MGVLLRTDHVFKTRASQILVWNHITWVLVKIQILIQKILGKLRNSVFLTKSQVVLLLVFGLYIEY